jgi:ATP-dependent DNA helicase RecQ
VENKYRYSTKLEILRNIIKEFESLNPNRKYKSDLEVFIRESKLEDFINENGESIFVSTIHKAKGKEFDNVFLMLENFNPATDEAKRLLYVAMTRAKTNLTIHLNSNIFDNITTDNLELIRNKETYLQPNLLAMHLSLKDIWLDYFIGRQFLISQLKSGDILIIKDNECLDDKGKSVLKFSKQFVEQIKVMKVKNYELKSAKVNFIVYWKKEDLEQELLIVLPELIFQKNTEEFKRLVGCIINHNLGILGNLTIIKVQTTNVQTILVRIIVSTTDYTDLHR